MSSTRRCYAFEPFSGLEVEIFIGMHLTTRAFNPPACEHRVCRWLGVDGLFSQTIEKLSASGEYFTSIEAKHKNH